MAVAKILGLTVVIVLFLSGFIVFSGIHAVPEGHVGVYWFGGAIIDKIANPGFHFVWPFVTRVEYVQYTLQTDVVNDIPCGTAGGTLIYFDNIEVVNVLAKDHVLDTVKKYGVDYDKTWIFNKVHHEINQFCSGHTLQEVYISQFDTLDESLATALQKDCDSWDTGISIVAIRVTKPRVPKAVKNNYERVEEEKTSLMVASQAQLVTQKEEETKRMQSKIRAEMEAEVSIINARKEANVAEIEAQRKFNVSRIEMQQQIKEQEAQATMELIQNEMHVAKQKALAEANRFQLENEAEGLKAKLTPAFLQYTLFQSLSNNTKIYFGENIPSMFLPFLSGNNDLEQIFNENQTN